MKENLVGVVNTFGNQFLKRSVTRNMTQMKTTDKAYDFFNRFGISWLPNYAKGFYLNSKQVKIINSPKVFYDLLVEKIKNASKRVVIASLYLGTGALEKNLVAVLNQRLYEKKNLTVRVLLDSIRGSRGEINSRKMLLPLLKNHENSCQISLYHTPALREPFLSFLPEKYRELISLQHIKVYLFDNDVIISGANLSSDYFTNRQDRYILVEECKELSDFVDGFIERVSEFSFQLDSNDELHLHPKWKHHPVKSKVENFIADAESQLKNYYKVFDNNKDREFDTVIFPLLEMGHYNIHMDSLVTIKLLEESRERIKAELTTGYFNLTHAYSNSIIDKSKAHFDILMAHPTANGFFNAEGPAKGIPFAYTELASQFLRKILDARQTNRINLFEYVRPGWTYHAKGLWLTNVEQEYPFLTLIGSPNFGERSIKRDLECQFLIATENEYLQRQLYEEKLLLFKNAQKFTLETTKETERIAPLWVKAVVLLFRSFL